MPNKMLIDASHPEETRVVVVRGNRIEEFDFESEHKKQIRGNIYLAKVTRVEPSLQAAFVEYGGNRHGFLAFAEIHPDYYQIPLADRQALLRAEAEEHRSRRRIEQTRTIVRKRETAAVEVPPPSRKPQSRQGRPSSAALRKKRPKSRRSRAAGKWRKDAPAAEEAAAPARHATTRPRRRDGHGGRGRRVVSEPMRRRCRAAGDVAMTKTPMTIIPARKRKSSNRSAPKTRWKKFRERVARKPRKQYKIQEVIKRRQILLVQVAKEERGNKGAALTTYLSLAGRYSVLMPNTARGGGISRKITNLQDRKRLKEIARTSKFRRAWASSCAPPAKAAPRSRSSATSNI
jgi:ribonuclease E